MSLVCRWCVVSLVCRVVGASVSLMQSADDSESGISSDVLVATAGDLADVGGTPTLSSVVDNVSSCSVGSILCFKFKLLRSNVSQWNTLVPSRWKSVQGWCWEEVRGHFDEVSPPLVWL